MDKLIRVEAVCALLHCTRETFYAKHRYSPLFPEPTTQQGDRSLWWDREKIETYKKKMRIE